MDPGWRKKPAQRERLHELSVRCHLVAAMNATNYLGHHDWQLPTTPANDTNCGRIARGGGGRFGFGCVSGALASMYNALGFKSPNTATPVPSNTVGPFHNIQAYLYWSQNKSGVNQGNSTFSFATGWTGSNTLPNFLYLLPMIRGRSTGAPAPVGEPVYR